MTSEEQKLLDELVAESGALLERLAQAKADGYGGREMSIAFTNFEQGRLWLKSRLEVVLAHQPAAAPPS